ncbi:response regulator transcription factor [bacterium AH-315-P13]|nr:response regulator transcription factor [bacterium AH-315-P13]
MKYHILIIEDEQDTFENMERRIHNNYHEAKISVASNCDLGFDIIKQNKVSFPVTLLILDLTFKNYYANQVIKNGKQLLKHLKINNLNIATIIYSSHDEMEYIHPVINNYHPKGYVIKSHNSSEELIFAIDRIIKGDTYFSQIVHQLQLQRFKYASKIDEVDEQIINFLSKANAIIDWEGKIIKDKAPLSYKSIKKRIDLLCDRLEVENDKQLLLKLQRLAII